MLRNILSFVDDILASDGPVGIDEIVALVHGRPYSNWQGRLGKQLQRNWMCTCMAVSLAYVSDLSCVRQLGL